ncbi:YjiH family protein [Bengtsoniella intestinalis]|uniref:YjiH family protein n=1 Tax=Bengtsoniella intestinalis TaxID=3073143 RepID=UPI00391F00CA
MQIRPSPALLAKFLVPSMVGISLFMAPIQAEGQWTIVVKIIADCIGSAMGDFLPLLCVLIVVGSGILSVVGLRSPRWLTGNTILKQTFITTPAWAVTRFVGGVFIAMTYFRWGAGNIVVDMIIGGGAGGFVLGELLTVLVIIFAIAGLLLPLLLDFGLLEFVGALLTGVMRPLFKIPGRAAVDCITSWLGDGTLGVMLTCGQYEQGFYSAREAAVIATTFSAVSITFSIVVLSQVGLMAYFGVYYVLICLVGVVCAVVCPRIPPLSRKQDAYLVEGKKMAETLPDGYGSGLEYGLHLACKRAAEFQGVGSFLRKGIQNSVDMWFGVLPVVMAVGTVALVLSNNTPVFEVLGLPFVPLLELLQVPEATAASKTMIVGFVDMFTPAILAAEAISSPMTRFIVATISVTQLIYLSEVGGLILGSKLPVKLWDLFLIFLERTLISLCIVAPAAHLIFGA